MEKDSIEFENEVRRIARQLWPGAEFGGATKEDGLERDGVFITEETVHLIEATTSPRKDKAVKDIQKLSNLAAQMRKRHPTKGVKAWFITQKEPTADQQLVTQATNNVVVAVSFDHFRSKLIDARGYLDTRANHPFGSVRDPETNSHQDKTKFIPMGLVSVDTQEFFDFNELKEKMSEGKSAVVLGDFGAGKSMTSRQLYRELARDFISGKSRRFPVFLNLREHNGQTYPAEAIERHSRNIGFSHPTHLVRAWKAGYVDLILDGFDEVATAGWAGSSRGLREIRFRAMELVRQFVLECPNDVPILITGRLHYFDGIKDLTRSLGIGSNPGRGFQLLSLNEFTDEQIKSYLGDKGLKASIPSWLPSRPLLLGYLASRDFLKRLLEDDEAVTPAAGWDTMLTRIAERESENIKAGLDADSIRLIIERLATRARASADGLGPLQPADLLETYKEVCSADADDSGMVLLQRLPGLGVANPDSGSRAFIDRDFAEAARAGDMSRFLIDPFHADMASATSWQSCLQPLGTEVLSLQCSRVGPSAGKFTTACKAALERGWNMGAVDLLLASNELGLTLTEALAFGEAIIPEFRIHSDLANLGGISIENSIIQSLDLDILAEPGSYPLFVSCEFGVVEGRSGTKDLPAGKFLECTVESFGESTSTTDAILNLALAPGTKVLLTVLKKLYTQSGSGRKESGLLRGLDPKLRDLVQPVLTILRNEGLALRSRTSREIVWLPVRSHSKRVLSILEAPTASSDPILKQSSRLR